MDWIGIILVACAWAIMVSIWLYGLGGGFRTWGRSLAGRLFLGAMSGPVLGSLLGGLGGAVGDRSNPWAPAHQQLGRGESVGVGLLTGAMLLGIPAAIPGAIIGLVIWTKARRQGPGK
jgi:hypothetical protein